MNRARPEDPDAWKRGYLDEATGEYVFPARLPTAPKHVEPPKLAAPTFRDFLDERREGATRTRAAMGRRLRICLVVGAVCVPCFAVPSAAPIAFAVFVGCGVVGCCAAFEWVLGNRELGALK